ncbi:MAG: acyl-CoA dehydrogenase family protein, partial [Pseudomonadota bacterium]
MQQAAIHLSTSILGKIVPPQQWSAKEAALLTEVDALCEALRPLAFTNDKTGRYPTVSMAMLKETSVLQAALPAELGGLGLGHRCTLEIQLRLACVDSAVAQIYKVHEELLREVLCYCPAFQRERIAAFVLQQRHILGLAVAEPNRSAVDPLKTMATATADGGFVVDGFKIYTTGAAEADHIATWAWNAASATKESPVSGIQMLLIPRGTAGVTVNRDWDALGQRATDSGSIKFTQVRCPPEWIASVPGKAPLIHSSVRYQAGFAALLIGMGIGALNAAVPYINERSRPWAQAGVEKATADPMILRTAGELAADLAVAWAATQQCGNLLDAFERGEIDRAQLALPISAAKSAASRAAMAATGGIHALMGT